METAELFTTLGLDEAPEDGDLVVRTPIDGSEIGRVPTDTAQSLDGKIAAADAAFDPAPTINIFIVPSSVEIQPDDGFGS